EPPRMNEYLLILRSLGRFGASGWHLSRVAVSQYMHLVRQLRVASIEQFFPNAGGNLNRFGMVSDARFQPSLPPAVQSGGVQQRLEWFVQPSIAHVHDMRHTGFCRQHPRAHMDRI